MADAPGTTAAPAAPSSTPAESSSPATTPGAESGGGSLDSLLAPPAATREGRDAQHAALREALSTGKGIEALFGEDDGDGQPADTTAFADVPSQDPEPAEDGDLGQQLAAANQELTEHRAMKEYYGAVYQALQQVQAQNELLARQLAGSMQVDADLARLAKERDAAAAVPDPETDPDGYARHMLREEITGVVEGIIGRERQTAEERQSAETQQKTVNDMQASVREAVGHWPELQQALNAYRDHGVAYYQGLGATPQQAEEMITKQVLSYAYQVQASGKSAGEALYHLTNAWDYLPAESSPAPAPVAPAVPAASPGQRFVDRAEAGATPASAGAVLAQTDDQRLQALMFKAGKGDQSAMTELLKHAQDLGDPRNPEVRKRLMSGWGQPM